MSMPPSRASTSSTFGFSAAFGAGAAAPPLPELAAAGAPPPPTEIPLIAVSPLASNSFISLPSKSPNNTSNFASSTSPPNEVMTPLTSSLDGVALPPVTSSKYAAKYL